MKRKYVSYSALRCRLKFVLSEAESMQGCRHPDEMANFRNYVRETGEILRRLVYQNRKREFYCRPRQERGE